MQNINSQYIFYPCRTLPNINQRLSIDSAKSNTLLKSSSIISSGVPLDCVNQSCQQIIFSPQKQLSVQNIQGNIQKSITIQQPQQNFNNAKQQQNSHHKSPTNQQQQTLIQQPTQFKQCQNYYSVQQPASQQLQLQKQGQQNIQHSENADRCSEVLNTQQSQKMDNCCRNSIIQIENELKQEKQKNEVLSSLRIELEQKLQDIEKKCNELQNCVSYQHQQQQYQDDQQQQTLEIKFDEECNDRLIEQYVLLRAELERVSLAYMEKEQEIEIFINCIENINQQKQQIELNAQQDIQQLQKQLISSHEAIQQLENKYLQQQLDYDKCISDQEQLKKQINQLIIENENLGNQKDSLQILNNSISDNNSKSFQIQQQQFQQQFIQEQEEQIAKQVLQRVNEFEDRLSNLINENEQLSEQLKLKEVELVNLQDAVSQKDANFKLKEQQANANLIQQQRKCEETSIKLGQMKRELQEKINNLITENGKLSETVISQKSLNEEQYQIIQQLQDQLKQTNEDFQNINSEIIKKQQQQFKSQEDVLRKQIDTLSQNNKILDSQLKKQCESAAETQRNLESQLQKLKDVAEQTKINYENQQQQLIERSSELQKNLEIMLQENERLNELNLSKLEELEKFQKGIIDLDKQTDMIKTNASTLQKENKELELKLAKEQQLTQQLKAQSQEQKNQLNGEISATQKINEQLEKNLVQISIERDNLSSNLELLQTEANSFKMKIKELELIVQQSKKYSIEHREVNTKLQAVLQENSELASQVDKLQQERDLQQQKLSSTEKNYQSQIETINKSYKDQLNQRLSEEANKYIQKLGQQNEQMDNLNKQNSQLQQNEQLLKNQIQDLVNELEMLKVGLKKLELLEKTLTSLDKENLQLQKDLKVAKKQISEYETNNSDKLVQKNSQIQELQQNLEKLQQKFLLINIENERLHSIIMQENIRIKKLQNSIQQKDQEINRYVSEEEKVKQLVDTNNQKLLQIQDYENIIQQFNIETTRLKELIENQESEILDLKKNKVYAEKNVFVIGQLEQQVQYLALENSRLNKLIYERCRDSKW